MNRRFVLDTNIVIGLLASDSAILDRIRRAAAVLIPVVVIGELYYGAEKSRRRVQNIERIAGLVGDSTVLFVDVVTSTYYGRIKRDLRRLGRPIPENDTWIAALALQHSATVASRDRHFFEIDGIAAEPW